MLDIWPLHISTILSNLRTDCEMNMSLRRRFGPVIFSAFIFILAGCGPGGFILPPREGPVGEKHTPVIEAIAGQNEIGTDQLWKIYIHATDPDGDIDKIWVFFSQPGTGGYPNYPLVLENPMKELNGAVLTWTRLAGSGIQSGLIYASVEIRVEDRAGNMSEIKKLEFTLSSFGPEDKFIPPPPFNKDLVYGQVEFPIQSEDDLLGDDDDRDD